jgi:hypothetical protein
MPRRIFSLNDSNWRFGSVAQKPFGDVSDLSNANDWLPAQVPGDVRLDLLRAGKISDPFYAANNEDSQWIDSRDWWYVREVGQELELEEDERAFLIFDGIDYQSAVFWNGKQLGRHVGMFSQQIVEIPNPKSEITNHKLPFAFGVPMHFRNSNARWRNAFTDVLSRRCIRILIILHTPTALRPSSVRCNSAGILRRDCARAESGMMRRLSSRGQYLSRMSLSSQPSTVNHQQRQTLLSLCR